MFSALNISRRIFGRAAAAIAFLALAACEPIELSGVSNAAAPGQTIDPRAPIPVALLIPRGSGNSADETLSASLENAARLAMASLNGATIDLRVYNTAGNPAQAASQAQKAVADGAKIILGPLYAESANAVGNAVAGKNINILAFSNNTTIAGGNVFVLGPTFTNTSRRLLRYAKSQGKSRVVILHDTGVAGQLGRNAIQTAAASAGVSVVGTVDYALSQEGVSNAVPRVKAAVDNGGADSVFLTSTSSGALPLFAGLLPQAGVSASQYQYIGLTRWDIPSQTLALPGLQGGVFARPDPARVAEFRRRYQAAVGSTPHPVAGLAFDGISAIGALAASGNRNALTRSALTRSAGFQGASGIFRLRGDGTNDRGLAIARITNNQAVIVDPAPNSFAGF